MIDPWGCPVCGGGAGRHDGAAHGDWPDEEPERCGCPDYPGEHAEDDCAALVSGWRSTGVTYDQGGNFLPGPTCIANETGEAEVVVPL